jgi:hypothetical protein
MDCERVRSSHSSVVICSQVCASRKFSSAKQGVPSLNSILSAHQQQAQRRRHPLNRLRLALLFRISSDKRGLRGLLVVIFLVDTDRVDPQKPVIKLRAAVA